MTLYLHIVSTYVCVVIIIRRIPEIVFKGSSVWDEMDEGDLLDVKDMLTWFLLSSIMERLFHAVLEVISKHCLRKSKVNQYQM